MKVTKVKVKNYKSILDSGDINLNEKINILAGKNNTGKSAFIEALYKVINGNRIESIPEDEKLIYIEIEINFSNEELHTLQKGVSKEYQVEGVDRFRLTYHYDNVLNNSCLRKIEMYHNNSFKPFYANKTIRVQGEEKYEYVIRNERGGGTTLVGGIPIFLINLYNFLKNKTVYISGSRFVPQLEDTVLHNDLSIEGTNLNAFLYSLHNNQEKIFDSIITTFTQIFNDVTSISTPINADSKTYISIYFEGLDTPIPLSNCGSGYTHVLLLLCVLFTKRDSVVLFDEPQVFLHPSAEKAIYDLVSDIGEHQYIFTTHSPILINYPVEKHLFHVSKDKGNSVFAQLEQMQEILNDIGVSNSDYALSDKVLFVEGETEELVIPLILSHFGMKQIGYNYRILNMKGTGNEFSKKTAMNNHREKLDLILGGVSKSPIPYKIIIDADNKPEEKIREIKQSYSDNIIILDRREYENYFLECYQELADIINSETEKEITNPEEIKYEIEFITSDTSNKKLFPRNATDILKDVVGSEVLERLFEKYTLTYNKVKYGLDLTKLVLERSPEKLEFFKNELKDFIKG